MKRIILITQDFILHTALHYYIDSLIVHQDMDELVHHIHTESNELKYVFLIDNRYPFAESVKVENALRHKCIKASFLAIQMSNIAYHILGYSHYSYVKFGHNLRKSIDSIISFVDKGELSIDNRVVNQSFISKFEITMLECFIFEGGVSSVASKMNMPVKKIYLYRELLYKKLGLPNFNQAFLYFKQHFPVSDFNDFNEKKLKMGNESY